MRSPVDRFAFIRGGERPWFAKRIAVVTVPLLLAACQSVGPDAGRIATETVLASPESPVDAIPVAAGNAVTGSPEPFGQQQETEPTPDPGQAKATKTATDKWDFHGVLYLWALGVSGVTTSGGTSNPINVRFGDVLSNANFAGSFMLKGRKGQWGFLADVTYADLGGEVPDPTGIGDANVSVTTALVEADATFSPRDIPSLEFVGGLRMLDVYQKIDFTIFPSVRSSTTVIDPVVGAQGSWQLGKDWWFRLRGDIGGFSISSEFTYQMYSAFRWNFAGDFGLDLAYRIMGYKIDQNDVEMELTIQGVALGLDYWF